MTDFPKYKANTVWWNSSSMYIRCPHCDKIHRHGFDGNYHVIHHRAPHCEGGESYTICFPSDGFYEIDRSRGLYVRAGADPAAYFAQFDPVPKVDVSDRRKWTEAREEVELDGLDFGPIRVNRLDLTVSDMIAAFAYRHSSIDESDASQNVTEDDRDGNNETTQTERERITTSGETALHMAACEMYPEMVKLLLDFGADPNVRTVDGRTPLMEAAIWGRLENVKCLLSHGADKSITCMREGKWLRAIDFAADTRENSEERYDRSGDKHQVYKEVTHERNQDRVAIVRELYDDVGEGESRNTAIFSHLDGFALTTLSDGRSIISLLANFDVPNRHKTIGILFRGDTIGGPGFPPVAAMSGWKHQTWTDEVLRLCRIVGHHLPADEKDQGRPGQFNACHAEKQLAAYFISKHVFLSPDLAVDDLGIDCEHQDMLDELQKVQPPERLQKGTILASRAICKDCNDFVEKVNMALGLMIEFRGVKQYS
ncbi:uncharacterized protein BKA55DRAFT_598575 [Fusarium redolens]|uniref:Single-strand DNA deaminase toxin A-like C-terminal domain-containing protein n=1 Tax=Fusarium redolens TaxID=48865 RepID=A0A9P9JT83_FUSRE|nr:uncharacterized protein BKA55DRAFT_598575 [Fusarium redolens]KAH7231300.1 hypothetical protein BKA55DRAFT_598575 [Fusarium redolens]